MQNQIDQISWMTAKTKAGAYDKIKYLTRNIAYPNFVTDYNRLNDMYGRLTFDDSTSYIRILDELYRFVQRNNFEPLTRARNETSDRDDFLDSPTIVNAW